jgi:phospholipid-binding lipoprotein MlaA
MYCLLGKICVNVMKFHISSKGAYAITALLLATSLSACATTQQATQKTTPLQPTQSANDPFERLNRFTFKANTEVDKVTFKPLARAYRAVTPKPIRTGVTNFFNHLGEPFTAINTIAQGKPNAFKNSFSRIIVNTVFGFAGFVDTAAKWGIARQPEDLGQTLAVWGIGEGPYLILPFLGPSNPRDFLGFTVEFFYDPVDLAINDVFGNVVSWSLLGAELVDIRANALGPAETVLDNSDDPYVTLRSAYRQRRAFLIRDGKPLESTPGNDLFEEPSAVEASPPPQQPPATMEAQPNQETSTTQEPTPPPTS